MYPGVVSHTLHVSGLETTKVLVGAADLPTFTVDALSEHVGVSRKTVDTVRRRYSNLFEQVGSAASGGRGRPAILWRLKRQEVHKVAEVVDRVRASLSSADQDALNEIPDEETARALVLGAVDSIGRAALRDEVECPELVRAARFSLASAGFQEGDPPPEKVSIETELAVSAAFTYSIASLIEAIRSGRQEDIDSTQSKALRLGVEASTFMSVEQWLPLARAVARAPSDVIGRPILVPQRHEDVASALFPDLRRVSGWHGYVCLGDPRGVGRVQDDPVATVLWMNNQRDIRDADMAAADMAAAGISRLFISRDPWFLDLALGYGAKFVLERASEATQLQVAQVVNRLTLGLE